MKTIEEQLTDLGFCNRKGLMSREDMERRRVTWGCIIFPDTYALSARSFQRGGVVEVRCHAPVRVPVESTVEFLSKQLASACASHDALCEANA